MQKAFRMMLSAFAASVLGAANGPYATAQQNAPSKIEQKDFVKKFEDVRRTLERDRNQEKPAANSDRAIADVCKRNPQLPQCR